MTCVLKREVESISENKERGKLFRGAYSVWGKPALEGARVCSLCRSQDAHRRGPYQVGLQASDQIAIVEQRERC